METVQPFVLRTFADDPEPPPGFAGEPWAAALVAAQRCVAAGGAGFDALLQAVVGCAVELVPGASLALVEMKAGDRLCLRAASGASGGALGGDIAIAGSFSGLCLDERRMLYCEDTAADARVDGAVYRRLGIRSLLAVPLPDRGEMAGVLQLHAATPHAFDKDDIFAALLLAGQIGLGLASMAGSAGRTGSEAERLYAASFHQAAIGIAHLSPGGEFLLVNDRLCEIAASPRSAMMHKGLGEIIHPADQPELLGLVDSLVSGTIGACEVDSRMVPAGSSPKWVHLAISLVRDEAGEPEFLVAAIEDISERKQAEDIAGHDPLTGLLNRRGIQERLERELDRAANTGGALTVTLLDLEGLDSLGAQSGPQESDLCLQRVGQALREVCRPGDAVGRVGENAFLLAMPGLEREPAIALLRRVKARIAKLAAAEGWPIGCSCGSASRLRDGATAESLVRLAGARMKASKTARRGAAA